jgi:sugar O-acyltransferase (sialic acid O-acetyltransferase NeuD family)
MSNPVIIPLLNPNESEVLLTALHIQEAQRVSQGDLLATLETTKSTAEIQAEASGFIVGLNWTEGQTIQSGEVLCYISENVDWSPPQAEIGHSRLDRSEIKPPTGVRITQPALDLARLLGIDLDRLPAGQLITESMVRDFMIPSESLHATLSEDEFDPSAIIVYGGGGHGKTLIDLLRTLRVFRIIGILDDGIEAGQSIMGVPVLGGGEKLGDIHSQGVRQAVNAVGGIGDISIRMKVFQRLKESGFICPAVVHPRATIEPSASIAAGVQIFAHAYIGCEAQVSFGCIVNTAAVVSHDCILGEYANISPGALLAGEVEIGPQVLIGMGATINLQVKVGAGARIGNGATVKEDVPTRGIVRAGTIWPLK